jgi:hypothetical protein
MKTKILQPIVLLTIIAILGGSLAYEVVQRHRTLQLLKPLKAQQARESRQRALRERFEKRMAQDQDKYTPEQLREAENMYLVASRNSGFPKGNESLETMIKKYPDVNRTGCATLDVAEGSRGDERAKDLQELH